MAQDYFVGGDYNAICDVGGEKVKASKLRLQWDGARVCDRHFSYRHPQDFVRGVDDQQGVPWSRPAGLDQFVENIPGVVVTSTVVPAENGIGGGTFTFGKISRDTL